MRAAISASPASESASCTAYPGPGALDERARPAVGELPGARAVTLEGPGSGRRREAHRDGVLAPAGKVELLALEPDRGRAARVRKAPSGLAHGQECGLPKVRSHRGRGRGQWSYQTPPWSITPCGRNTRSPRRPGLPCRSRERLHGGPAPRRGAAPGPSPPPWARAWTPRPACASLRRAGRAVGVSCPVNLAERRHDGGIRRATSCARRRAPALPAESAAAAARSSGPARRVTRRARPR